MWNGDNSTPFETVLQRAERLRVAQEIIDAVRALTVVGVAFTRGQRRLVGLTKHRPQFVHADGAPLPVPDELAVAIASRCSPRSLVALSGTCTAWHRIALDYYVLHAVLRRALPAASYAVLERQRADIYFSDLWAVVVGLAEQSD